MKLHNLHVSMSLEMHLVWSNIKPASDNHSMKILKKRQNNSIFVYKRSFFFFVFLKRFIFVKKKKIHICSIDCVLLIFVGGPAYMLITAQYDNFYGPLKRLL